MAEMRASPVVNPYYKRIAEMLADLQGPMGQIIPGTDFNPFQVLMPQASTFENLAYGNSPFSEYAGVTNRRLPIVKTGREGELTDIADVALMASGVPAVSRGVARGANYLGDVMTQAVTRNPQATSMRALDEISRMSPVSQMAASKPVKRSEIQAEAKSLGLPSSGKTEEIQELIGIVKLDPKTWTQEQYNLIRPHLAIHQDFRPGSAERSESIMREGLRSGMVDYLEPMERGEYSYAKGLIGTDAYLFPSRGLKFKSASDPHLAPGNIPLFRITPQKGQNIYEAIVQTAEKRQADDVMAQFLKGK